MSDDEKVLHEPNIIINGIPLDTAMAMTTRVAVGSFLISLEADGLGDDEMGRQLARAYMQQCRRLLDVLHQEPSEMRSD